MKIKLFAFIIGAFLLTGCFDYDDVVYQGIESVKIGKISEGKTPISFNIKLDNPNNYKIKIKPSDLTVYIGGKELGEVHLKQTLVIKKKSSNSYPLTIEAKLKDIALSSISGLMEMATKKTVTIRFKGFVRGSVYGVTQKRFVDQSKEIETSQLMKLLGL